MRVNLVQPKQGLANGPAAFWLDAQIRNEIFG